MEKRFWFDLQNMYRLPLQLNYGTGEGLTGLENDRIYIGSADSSVNNPSQVSPWYGTPNIIAAFLGS
ncbi:hypothetical protein ABAC460_17455 [Asticcacaulis sp. AC460]|uniref:hypothetical protein n=1 Tax=Asticcacaulis sp. AC460 TaxID=1282360 RepID=UPI0003C3D78D|nr:hypothetical protein [Asticcacaulis sp. AC460]ESQ87979.1 hypothetical protein ABAC460_17455 [Asticcacaulis sp. AC460]